MIYNSEISERVRCCDQLEGFLQTHAPKFWMVSNIEQFELPLPEVFLELAPIRENMVLGKRAELFFMSVIAASKRYKVLANNTQLIKDGITLGELDFLLMDTHTNRIIHVEMGYKFYLLKKDEGPDLAQWVGPNMRDSLNRKWNKLRDVQFKNLYSPTAKILLAKMGLETSNIKQALYMPIQLFAPFGKNAELEAAAKPCLAGKWMNITEFEEEDWSRCQFFLPEKQDWLVNPNKCHIWFSQNDLMPAIMDAITKLKSPLVWVKRPEKSFLKIFITFWR